ncbi:hypothetical protein EIN_186370 [Entamoeba invadens IP1]|uniref:hypothetical protein n=1 Tax=Entamoeba invadens IP1 TaxID=370355 RepID=UPI0002C3F528|nr:hypothetical protein EIN_186370 [Entamoeba invadens IP1]ELP94210.1 hypothetical protein EIN_186370 [Entamoeba invadens IP1]|eukprot:XP_004260981.1 hypothetical protein EIN_186370 [Entamoeba invadens IP1]
MPSPSVILEQFGTLFVIIASSYILKIIYYRNNIRDHSSLVMKVLFNLAFPCVIFRSLSNTRTLDINSLAMFISGFVLQTILSVVAFILFKFVLKCEVPWQIEFGGCVGLNIGLFLFPILETFDPENGISHAILFNVSNDVACYFILRPIFALMEGTAEKDDIDIELASLGTEMENTPDSGSMFEDKTPVTHPISTPLEQNSLTLETPRESGEITRDSIEVNRANPTIDVKYGDKKTELQKAPVSWKYIFMTIAKSIITCIPLYVMPIGYTIGLKNIEVPHFMMKVINTVAGGNTLLSYAVLGFFFEWKNKARVYFISLRVLAIRYVTALIVGVSIFFITKNYISFMTRFIIILCCICPAPSLSVIYSIEYQTARLDVTAAIVGISVGVSFVSVLALSLIFLPYN